ncbi:MAG: hypothetical protein H6871_04430 [Methylobacteriaceae bacterium]|nr:hypothetical protein [Methylobacteriaceae bacterium]
MAGSTMFWDTLAALLREIGAGDNVLSAPYEQFPASPLLLIGAQPPGSIG